MSSVKRESDVAEAKPAKRSRWGNAPATANTTTTADIIPKLEAPYTASTTTHTTTTTTHPSHSASLYSSSSSSSTSSSSSLSHTQKVEANKSTSTSAPAPPPPTTTTTTAAAAAAPIPKATVNLGLSGKLSAVENSVAGTALKYSEPVDARVPDTKWRLYVFKDKKCIGLPLLIHSKSCYLVGKDEKVCDLVIQHESASRQHAVIQFRQKEVVEKDGTLQLKIKPYLMDLGSTNGTLLQGKKIDSLRYYGLLTGDVIQFAYSTREYVLLHENATKTEIVGENADLDEFEKEGVQDQTKKNNKASLEDDYDPWASDSDSEEKNPRKK